jgi:hypothetical protein
MPLVKRTILLQVYVTREMNDLIRKLAAENDRSLSSTVGLILEKGLGMDPISPLFLREEETP